LCSYDLPVVFVENKIDLIAESTLDPEQVETMAKKHRFRLYRASAIKDYNVNEAFGYLVQKAATRFPDPNILAIPCQYNNRTGFMLIQTLIAAFASISRSSSTKSAINYDEDQGTTDTPNEEVLLINYIIY
jgi:hypothetical protein